MQKQSRSGCFKTKLRPDSRLDPKKLKRVSVLLKARIQAQSSVGNFEKLKRYRAHSVSEGRFHFNRDKEKPEVFRDRKRPIRVFVPVSDHFSRNNKMFRCLCFVEKFDDFDSREINFLSPFAAFVSNSSSVASFRVVRLLLTTLPWSQ